MKKKYLLYHNPKCSKSKLALNLLEERGITPTIKLYLEEKLIISEVANILMVLDRKPIEGAIRINEIDDVNIKKELMNFSISQWAQLVVDNPFLLERPILFDGTKAVLGRPPENILKLI